MGDVVTKETQIQVQLVGVENQIGELENHTLLLFERLQSILIPFRPTTNICEEKATSDVPLAKQLNDFKNRLEAITDGVKDAILRCEL